jgi:hypothetical protein
MNRLSAIIIAVLILSLSGMYGYTQHLQNKLDKAEDYKSLYETSVKENKIWKDEAGQWRNKAEVANASASTLKELAKQGDPRMTQILKEFEGVKKSFKNLESFTELQAQTISQLTGMVKDSSIKVIKGNDTITVKVKKIRAQNDWNKYDITVFGDTANIKREGKEEFDQAVFWERKWFLGKKKWSSEIVSKNPETKIIKQSSLSVKKRRK